MVYENILQAVGKTPLIRLNKMTGRRDAEIYVKFEGLCAGGSVKTRTALRMIEEAEKKGLLGRGSVIVEPTSGNQGIGLALVGAVKGYRVVIVMPDSVSEERRKLIRHYGAEVILVHDEGDIGACVRACIRRAEEFTRGHPGAFLPQQFENTENVLAHRRTTAREILRDLNRIDGFCSGIGTGGTITGVGRELKKVNPRLIVWAAEPENAAILACGESGAHLQMGIGDGIVPPILDKGVYSKICLVSDEEAVDTARMLAQREGIACGISGGTNVAVAKRLARKLGAGKRVVTLLPDTAERYYSTPLFDGE